MATSGKCTTPKVSSEMEAGITHFDQSSLKHTETVEKQRLPSVEVICQEKTLQNIEAFNKDSLKHTETSEKNTLPSIEVIKAEKRASGTSS